jgi:2-oxo-4-hydroxy-4-carboxy--5-ureidoimidazoline (OHCU) decarboxylase
MTESPIAPKVEHLGFPVDVMQHVLWFFGDRTYGVEPGSFRSRLMLTVSAADLENREALRRAFPELVRAMDFVQHETLGFEQMREQAARALQVAS